MPRITVEHGGRFVHCVASQLQEVLRQLGDASPRGGGGGDVLTVATQVAASCLQLFAAPELDLVAPATGSFGTALRSRRVRALLGQASVRGTPLLQVLEWIRAAADAQRHLVPALMLDARQAVEVLVRLADTYDNDGRGELALSPLPVGVEVFKMDDEDVATKEWPPMPTLPAWPLACAPDAAAAMLKTHFLEQFEPTKRTMALVEAQLQSIREQLAVNSRSDAENSRRDFGKLEARLLEQLAPFERMVTLVVTEVQSIREQMVESARRDDEKSRWDVENSQSALLRLDAAAEMLQTRFLEQFAPIERMPAQWYDATSPASLPVSSG